jgi:hypothetical protein
MVILSSWSCYYTTSRGRAKKAFIAVSYDHIISIKNTTNPMEIFFADGTIMPTF